VADRQTDRQTDTGRQLVPHLRIASRGKSAIFVTYNAQHRIYLKMQQKFGFEPRRPKACVRAIS